MNFIAVRIVFELLKNFWQHDICCHICCSLPTYLTGLKMGFHKVSFSIALKEPIILLIFQRGETLRENFYIGRYHFTLYQNLPNANICRYVLRRVALEYYFTFLGIDSVIECGTKSNVDFIHFVWGYRGSKRIPAACNRAVSRQGVFHNPSSVCTGI